MPARRPALRQASARALLAALVVCVLLADAHPASAQATQPSIFYVYDDLNRLIAVVDQQGNASTCTYDAVGNILADARHPRRDRINVNQHLTPDRGLCGHGGMAIARLESSTAVAYRNSGGCGRGLAKYSDSQLR